MTKTGEAMSDMTSEEKEEFLTMFKGIGGDFLVKASNKSLAGIAGLIFINKGQSAETAAWEGVRFVEELNLRLGQMGK